MALPSTFVRTLIHRRTGDPSFLRSCTRRPQQYAAVRRFRAETVAQAEAGEGGRATAPQRDAGAGASTRDQGASQGSAREGHAHEKRRAASISPNNFSLTSAEKSAARAAEILLVNGPLLLRSHHAWLRPWPRLHPGSLYLSARCVTAPHHFPLLARSHKSHGHKSSHRLKGGCTIEELTSSARVAKLCDFIYSPELAGPVRQEGYTFITEGARSWCRPQSLSNVSRTVGSLRALCDPRAVTCPSPPAAQGSISTRGGSWPMRRGPTGASRATSSCVGAAALARAAQLCRHMRQ